MKDHVQEDINVEAEANAKITKRKTVAKAIAASGFIYGDYSCVCG